MKETFKAHAEELLIESRIVQHESKHAAEPSQDEPKTYAPPHPLHSPPSQGTGDGSKHFFWSGGLMLRARHIHTFVRPTNTIYQNVQMVLSMFVLPTCHTNSGCYFFTKERLQFVEWLFFLFSLFLSTFHCTALCTVRCMMELIPLSLLRNLNHWPLNTALSEQSKREWVREVDSTSHISHFYF